MKRDMAYFNPNMKQAAVADSQGPKPELVKLKFRRPIQKLTDTMLRCYAHTLSGLSLQERLVKIQSYVLNRDLAMKLFQ